MRDEEGTTTAMEERSNTYAKTVYRGSLWEEQSPYQPHTFSGMVHLPHRDYRNVNPSTYTEDIYDVIHGGEDNLEDDDCLQSYQFNSRMIRTITVSRSMVIPIIASIGGLGLSFISFLMFLDFFIDPLPNQIKNTEILIKYGSLTVLGLFSYCIQFMPRPITKFFFGDVVPHIQMSRQTGMVTIWKYIPILGIKRKTIIKPFSEFIPYLHQLVTPTGTGAGWNVILAHKDSRRISFGAIGMANLKSRGDALAFWDFLQRYMDVEQPLPDSPIFETVRHLDPTTKAYDEMVGRPAKYWKRMTKAQIDRRSDEMAMYIERLASGEDLPPFEFDYEAMLTPHEQKQRKRAKKNSDA
ncbi:hypothetical protein [Enterovibrio norvegicus]|uniref:hypothetical protein n=1 Tax=Enterovibrio norvegicus TaxID=188144 RepID=UPI000C8453B7|nr:hypothetical protein [Enterovibrio norvegicus]PML79210.1 hypothetical protein BCT69_14605 [Enterovibrio norvegicus]